MLLLLYFPLCYKTQKEESSRQIHVNPWSFYREYPLTWAQGVLFQTNITNLFVESWIIMFTLLWFKGQIFESMASRDVSNLAATWRDTSSIHQLNFLWNRREWKANLPLGSISLQGSSHTWGTLVAYAWWHKWMSSEDWCSSRVPCECRWLSETRVVKNFSTELKRHQAVHITLFS